jgi:hypothetical protein
METKRMGEYKIMQVLKETAKTSIVKELTELYSCEERVKNSKLSPDPIHILTTENARTASTVLNIAHPEYGVKRFDFNEEGYHSIGTGSNSKVLFESNFSFYRIITFK